MISQSEKTEGVADMCYFLQICSEVHWNICIFFSVLVCFHDKLVEEVLALHGPTGINTEFFIRMHLRHGPFMIQVFVINVLIYLNV